VKDPIAKFAYEHEWFFDGSTHGGGHTQRSQTSGARGFGTKTDLSHSIRSIGARGNATTVRVSSLIARTFQHAVAQGMYAALKKVRVDESKRGCAIKLLNVQINLMTASCMQATSKKRFTHTYSTRRFSFSFCKKPAANGCLDPRLGVSDKTSVCATCKRKLVDCAGHFGYIKLALPVFHIGFLRHTIHILQCICKSCSRVLLADTERAKQLERMRNPKTDALIKASILKKLVDKCKKVKICPHCLQTNGTVKKVTGAPSLKIVHEKFRSKRSEEEREQFAISLESAIQYNPAIAGLIDSPVEDLMPTRVLDLFSQIPDADCEILWVNPIMGRPENLILQTILVPPVPIRPSVAMDVGGGSNEDDLTVMLQEIIDVNVALEMALTKGPLTRTIMEEWDFLQVQVAQYINGEMPGMQRPIGAKPMRG
jgi:DNA-directed RNA polymerase beta' subunit